MESRRQKCFIACLTLWSLYGILCPVWVGRSYSIGLGGSLFPRSAGAFVVTGPKGASVVAPVWNPPGPSGDPLGPMVRWPLQKPYRHHHQEIDFVAIFMRWTIGMIALGFTYRFYCWFRPVQMKDHVLDFAWPSSISLALAWVCILTAGASTMGYAFNDSIIFGFLSIGLASGAAFGAMSSMRMASRKLTMKKSLLEGNIPATPNAKIDGQGVVSFSDYYRFGLGAVAGLFVYWAASLWDHLHGAATGLGIILVGWLTGLLFARLANMGAFAFGIAVTTTYLAIFFVFWR